MILTVSSYAPQVLYGISAAVYVYSAAPKLSKFTSLPLPLSFLLSSTSSPRFPSPLRQSTIELASSHLICAVALTGVLILQAAKYWADGEDDDGSLEERVDTSLGNWKRTKRPIVNEREKSDGSAEGRRGSFSGERERERRGSNARTSESPSTRRRSPVKRKAGSVMVTR
jgi:hypothetical protein